MPLAICQHNCPYAFVDNLEETLQSQLSHSCTRTLLYIWQSKPIFAFFFLYFFLFLFFFFPLSLFWRGLGPLTTLYSSYSSHLLEVVVFFKGSWKFHQIHFMIIYIRRRDIWVTFKGRQQVSLIRHNSLSFFFIIKDVSHERLKEYKVTYTNLYRWSRGGVRGSGAIVLLPAVRFRIYTISDV